VIVTAGAASRGVAELAGLAQQSWASRFGVGAFALLPALFFAIATLLHDRQDRYH
jgi:hypothetical protein